MLAKMPRVLLLSFLLFFVCHATFASTAFRTRYMGTSNFSMPTGFTRSAACYLNDSSHSSMLLSQAVFNGYLEFSMLRHLNGDEKGKNPLNAKVKLLEEGSIVPSLVWGVGDINTQLGSKIFFFSASKNIEVFGVQLHAGFYKDPITTDKKMFYGFEKMVFPLVTLAAERNDDIDAYGIKLSPYPGVSLEIAQRNSKEELYNINYYRSF